MLGLPQHSPQGGPAACGGLGMSPGWCCAASSPDCRDQDFLGIRLAFCSLCCFYEVGQEPPANVEMLVCSPRCATGDLCPLSGWLWPLLPHACRPPRPSPLRLHPLGPPGPAPAAGARRARAAPRRSIRQSMLGVRTLRLGQASAALMSRPRLRSPWPRFTLPAPCSPSARPSPARPAGSSHCHSFHLFPCCAPFPSRCWLLPHPTRR